MARKKIEESTGEFSFDAVTVVDSDNMPGRAPRAEKANPLLPAVQDSLNKNKAKALPAIPVSAAKDADNYLRRAAIKLGCGISIRSVDNEDGTVTVHFHATHEKRNRTYTVADVRAWALAQGWREEDLYPKVPREISNAYREEHGMRANKVSE